MSTLPISVTNYARETLARLVALPTVSAEGRAIPETAQAVKALLEELGLEVQIHPTAGAPVVYAEGGDLGGPILLCYNHYDVQPADPLELWESDPFTLTEREGKLYGRGSSDDKGELVARLAALHWLKRAFLELGGKDGIIVDETADINSAANTILQSAFGFQGQKCSAASRLIVVDKVHDHLIDQIISRAEGLVVGPAEENPDLGPVASAQQENTVLRYIDIGQGEAKLALGGRRLEGSGYFISPTIFTDASPDARISQEEIFGPVLSVVRVPSFDAALEVANGTRFGLTGGVISRDRARLERARKEFHVGNLYFNRKITGALVGVQPFGGFNLSGTDTKAGGPDYMLNFLQMKSVTERY